MVPGLLALAACTADTDDGVTHSGIPVTLTQTTVATDTRAAGNLNNNYITSGEHILVKITDAALRTLDYFYTAGDEGALAPKLGCVEAYYPSSGNVDIAAWYPWTTTDPFFVADDQTTDADYMASDLMFAMAKGQNRNSGEVPLEFYHKMAKLNVTVTPGSDLSDVTELRLKSVQRGVTANLLTGAVAALTIGDTYPADDIVMSTSNHGSVVFPPQVLDGEFLEVTTDEGTAVFALDAPKEFKAGHEYTLEIQMTNMSVGAATVIEGWGDNGTLAVYINRSQYELYIDAIPDMPWSGSAILPQPDVTYNGEVLTLGTDYVLEYIRKHPDDSGIIYCATRKNVDSLFELLSGAGVSVAKYHAGMSNEDRKASQNDFIYDRTSVIIATNAFGMGIDKSNVRFVIHYNMPQSMENYYQEAGRAGRDGETSSCILLFSAQDIMINKFLLEHKDFTDIPEEDIDLIKQRDAKRLQVMEGYCRTSGCLRNYILEYFGEKRSEPCNNCGNCGREFTEIDMTQDAKTVINCVWETKGRYGLNIVLGTLLGANRARLKELGTVNYKTYGALKNRTESELRLLISQLISAGYLYQTADRYSVIRMGDIAPLKDPNTHVLVRTYKDAEAEHQKESHSRRSTDSLTGAGYGLFEDLRQLRLAIAREEGLPPYIIFSDKTLIDMCVKTPTDKNTILNVSGVGEAKYAKYGDRFIDAVKAFLEDHPGAVTSIRDEDAAANNDAIYQMKHIRHRG